MNKHANGYNTNKTKRKKTYETNRKTPSRYIPSKTLISQAVRYAGPQVTIKLDRVLHSTTESLLEKQLSIDNKYHGITKMVMKHDLIPQNVNILPRLAFQEVLK